MLTQLLIFCDCLEDQGTLLRLHLEHCTEEDESFSPYGFGLVCGNGMGYGYGYGYANGDGGGCLNAW